MWQFKHTFLLVSTLAYLFYLWDGKLNNWEWMTLFLVGQYLGVVVSALDKRKG